MIETVTDQSGHDLNEVSAVLHKQIDRGYISPTLVCRLANLITAAREKALAAFLAEAQDFDAESIMAPNAEAEQVWRDAADRIRRVAEEAT